MYVTTITIHANIHAITVHANDVALTRTAENDITTSKSTNAGTRGPFLLQSSIMFVGKKRKIPLYCQ